MLSPMKKLYIPLLAAVLLPFFTAAQPSSPPIPGRFQLVSGRYVSIVVNRPASDPREGLFKIDTSTGQVWELIQIIDPASKSTAYQWSEIVGK
jgi:hypothetical protein